MSADKYPSIFSRQMKAIVYIIVKICQNASRVTGSRDSETPKWISFHIGRNIYASAYRFLSKLTGR